jgi:hypothetical protein
METMTVKQAILSRNSVRRYTDREISPEIREELSAEISACNRESGLNIQVLFEEPEAFGSILTHYGMFSGVRNYIAMVGSKSPDLDERVGYYGERIVLKAQMLGLNTCWVAKSFGRRKCKAFVGEDEVLVCAIALGYGQSRGAPRRTRPMESLCEADPDMPDWFTSGMNAAMLAPTAMNQQRFFLERHGREVIARPTGENYAKIDLGIVKYHFEIGAGKDNFTWG